VNVGTTAIVSNEPNDKLNGFHVALGNDPDQPATYWNAA
jgi:hypothetical protein